MPKYNQEIRDIYAGLQISQAPTDDFTTEASAQRGSMDKDPQIERYVYESTKKYIQIGQ